MKAKVENNVLHKYEKTRSILRKVQGGAWTINLDEFNLDEIQTIVYETTKEVFRISKERAKRA